MHIVEMIPSIIIAAATSALAYFNYRYIKEIRRQNEELIKQSKEAIKPKLVLSCEEIKSAGKVNSHIHLHNIGKGPCNALEIEIFVEDDSGRASNNNLLIWKRSFSYPVYPGQFATLALSMFIGIPPRYVFYGDPKISPRLKIAVKFKDIMDEKYEEVIFYKEEGSPPENKISYDAKHWEAVSSVKKEPRTAVYTQSALFYERIELEDLFKDNKPTTTVNS